jgi:putative Ca2+/H+ antiporter (TMEM165/GDT1 family)
VEAFFVTLVTVGLSEMGDKTQLLVLLLAAQFRRPAPILVGLGLAVLANNTLAVVGGAWLRATLGEETLRWTLGIAFLLLALWALRNNAEGEEKIVTSGHSALLVSLVTLFLSDIGDKSQIATAALAIKYGTPLAVIAGGTLGAFLVDVPVVVMGKAAAHRIPRRPIRFASAALFAVLGIGVLAAGWLKP